jgi:hypothetical protein
MVRDSYAPSRLVGVDLLPWLEADLKDQVQLVTGPAEQVVAGLQPADRVLLVETLEHLTAPWDVLAVAASRVAPGGLIVVSTPHIGNLRHRLELATRGSLTSFRPDNEPHVTPALPHVIRRSLETAGLTDVEVRFAGPDVIPFTGGRVWPRPLHRRFVSLCSVSVAVSARRQR